MAIGDKVTVGDGYHWSLSDNQKVMAYMPKLDSNGQWIVIDGKSILVESVGGVVCGSKGVVDGHVIRVTRSNLQGQPKGYNGNDFVELVPVNLEVYKRVGYFLVDNVRISAT
jgi:hypothetical protein